MGKVCKKLPGMFRHSCKKLVHKYSSKIVNDIVNGMHLDSICKSVGACSTDVGQSKYFSLNYFQFKYLKKH